MVISIAILCGGRSKRFGSKKIFHKIDGKTILQIVYDKFKNSTNDIFLQISNNQECFDNFDNYDDFNEITIEIRKDLIPDAGPLGGLYSALMHSKNKYTFIVAGDLPFIDERILDHLKISQNFKAIVPQWANGYLEPLCAIYSKEVLPVIDRQLNDNDLKISNLYKTLDKNINEKYSIKYLNIDELINQNRLNPDCFRNINTLSDLEIVNF